MRGFLGANARRIAALTFLGVLSGGCSGASCGAAARANVAESNRKLVEDFFDLAFVQGRVAQAADRYLGDRYLQHNPDVADGKQAFVEAMGGYLAATPGLRIVVKRVIADADLVLVHSLYQDQGRSTAVADVFRVENSKIVEHWDVQQQIPAETASGRPMV